MSLWPPTMPRPLNRTILCSELQSVWSIPAIGVGGPQNRIRKGCGACYVWFQRTYKSLDSGGLRHGEDSGTWWDRRPSQDFSQTFQVLGLRNVDHRFSLHLREERWVITISQFVDCMYQQVACIESVCACALTAPKSLVIIEISRAFKIYFGLLVYTE